MSICPIGVNNNLKFLLNKRFDQTFSMLWIGDNPDKVSYMSPNNVIKYSTGKVYGISKITDFTSDIEGENKYQSLKIFFLYKNGTEEWSKQRPIEELTGMEFDPNKFLVIQLVYMYAYDVSPKQYNLTNIYIKYIKIDGEYILNKVDANAILDKENPEVILQPKDIYKVFRLDGFEIIKQDTGDVDYEIFYRFSQNAGRTFTPFEPLTQDNIKTLRLDELRFAQVQYHIKFLSNTGALVIYDVMLLGDFQNVSANYLKTNRYGLRQECVSFLLNNGAESGTGLYGGGNKWTNSNSSNAYPTDYTNVVEYPDGKNNLDGYENIDFKGVNINNIETKGLSCYIDYSQMNMDEYQGVGGYWGVGGDIADQGGFWNPYISDQIVSWQNVLANQMNSIFGWKVNYFLTDPDEKGIDRYMHEYQLHNVIKVSQLKIIVPQNNFPDETIQLNYFNLDLFDTLEINIIKDEFKRAFGIQRRPRQNDIIHICITNKLYFIKHIQAVRDVMNASIYYKAVLEKYEQRADIDIKDENSKEILEGLTKNTTIDEILGPEKQQEEKKIANKKQTFSLAYDKIRHRIYTGVKIENKKIYNDNVVLSDSYYDLSKRKNKIAIDYTTLDNKLEKGHNRTFMMWFNAKSKYDPTKHLSSDVFNGYYPENISHSLLDNYDQNNKKGYRLLFEGDGLYFQINDKVYDLETDILTDVWYAFVVSLDQRQHKVKLRLYKRNMDIAVTLFNKETYDKKELLTYTDLDESYDPDNIDYKYENAVSEGYLPVLNTETNYYAKQSDDLDKLLLIDEKEFSIKPFEFEHTETVKIIGSEIRYTNLRVFDDSIKESLINSVLSEAIVRDEHHLVLFDNANREIKARTIYNRRFE